MVRKLLLEEKNGSYLKLYRVFVLYFNQKYISVRNTVFTSFAAAAGAEETTRALCREQKKSPTPRLHVAGSQLPPQSNSFLQDAQLPDTKRYHRHPQPHLLFWPWSLRDGAVSRDGQRWREASSVSCFVVVNDCCSVGPAYCKKEALRGSTGSPSDSLC